MTKTVSIGKQDFASLREQNSFYIDKTELDPGMVGITG